MIRAILSFIRPPELRGQPYWTYRSHLGFALLDSASAGILSNTGLMAVRELGAEDWHLGVRLPLSSAGMFAALFLGSLMAKRRKMPFVVAPGIAFAQDRLDIGQVEKAAETQTSRVRFPGESQGEQPNSALDAADELLRLYGNDAARAANLLASRASESFLHGMTGFHLLKRGRPSDPESVAALIAALRLHPSAERERTPG